MQRDLSVVMPFAFAGGFADASSMLRFHTFTGHVTGNLVLLTISVAAAKWADASLRAVAVVSFALCTAAGSRLARAPRCWLWIFALQALLVPTACALRGLFAWPELFGVIALCCSLGLQNGAFTSVTGVSMHSTFVSGDLTALIRTLMQNDALVPVTEATARERTRRVLCALLCLSS